MLNLRALASNPTPEPVVGPRVGPWEEMLDAVLQQRHNSAELRTTLREALQSAYSKGWDHGHRKGIQECIGLTLRFTPLSTRT